MKPALPDERFLQQFLCESFDVAVEFSRRAARLFQHRRIEQQRDAPDERSFFLARFLSFARDLRRCPPRAEIRVQREIATELAAIFCVPLPRAIQRAEQFGKKRIDRGAFPRP